MRRSKLAPEPSRTEMEHIVPVLIGVGLAASCGFRVFVPLLAMGVAAQCGLLTLAPGWEWIGSWPAIIAFAAATLAEIAGYYIPWVDNLLDTVASPAAVIAGIVTTAACITGMDPLLQWSLAIIAGGGAAGATQSLTVVARGASTAVTGGLGNFVVATLEWLAALFFAVLAIVAPVLALLLLAVALVWLLRWAQRRQQPVEHLGRVAGAETQSQP